MRLAEVVAQIENDRKVVLSAGHNPGIEGLLLLLTGNSEQMPARQRRRDLAQGDQVGNSVDKSAQLKWLVTPKELKTES